MIDMGMGQYDSVYRFGIKRRLFPVKLPQSAPALKHAAIYKQLPAVDTEQMFGTGNGAGSAMKGKGYQTRQNSRHPIKRGFIPD